MVWPEVLMSLPLMIFVLILSCSEPFVWWWDAFCLTFKYVCCSRCWLWRMSFFFNSGYNPCNIVSRLNILLSIWKSVAIGGQYHSRPYLLQSNVVLPWEAVLIDCCHMVFLLADIIWGHFNWKHCLFCYMQQKKLKVTDVLAVLCPLLLLNLLQWLSVSRWLENWQKLHYKHFACLLLIAVKP